MRSHFPFATDKATDVAGIFMTKAGGAINVMKLVKLAYLLDRESIRRRRVAVIGGLYFSMKNGPVTSELLDLANWGQLGNQLSRWPQFISDKAGYELGLESDPGVEHLSQSEIALAEEIWERFGSFDQWELRDWCHRHCPEWTQLDSGRQEISLRKLCESLQMSDSESRDVTSTAAEMSFVASSLK